MSLRAEVPHQHPASVAEGRHPVADGLDGLGCGRGDRLAQALEGGPLLGRQRGEIGVDLGGRHG